MLVVLSTALLTVQPPLLRVVPRSHCVLGALIGMFVSLFAKPQPMSVQMARGLNLECGASTSVLGPIMQTVPSMPAVLSRRAESEGDKTASRTAQRMWRG